MSTSPAFIVHDGKLDNTEDLKETLGLSEGERLLLISDDGQKIVLRREQSREAAPPIRLSHQEYMAGWDSLRGVLKDGIDTAEERIREKREERERELRNSGE